MTEIDDQTVAYVVVAQSCFEDLKQVAAQLAGLLVMEAAGSKTPDHPMLASAEQVYRNAVDGLRSARVPARAKEHHEHLLAAAAMLKSPETQSLPARSSYRTRSPPAASCGRD